ncbi:restriction endonuclease [Peribacillus asahii]|uniref:Restriction endonuclease n=2 Tax=Peribacillus asahii TaxID=228899 RepID=A0A3T0KU14_9BACI|nr:restriction endonuclease [Peribacillus asahii]
MAIIEGQMVKVKWTTKNKKYFELFGYQFTCKGEEFEIRINELNKGSRIEIECTCNQCKDIFKREAKRAFKSDKHFCSNECRNKYNKLNPITPETKVEYNCDMCDKSFRVANYRFQQVKNGEHENLFCSRECQGKWNSLNRTGENNPHFNSIKINCEYCEEEFSVPKHRQHTAKFCSDKCKRIGSRKRIEINCGVCNKKLEVAPSKIEQSKSGQVFCSNECVGKYNAIRHKENRINKTCLICNTHYDVKPSEAEKSVTCSVECQKIWQSKYLIGENANNYNSNITSEMRMHNCDWCGTKYELKAPYKIKMREQGKSLFCSIRCYREWYAKEWSQSLEWKDESRMRAVRMLEDGTFNKTDTECQMIINEILDNLKIKYENEYNCKYYAVDNYLVDYNLMIEVNGGYWHADPRIYHEINYQNQVDRIKNDKAKNTYIKNNYEINILYLWEEDILENRELCELLIKEYIESQGKLDYYHSFNYALNDNKIEITNNIIIPFMEYSIEELRTLINIVGKKKNKKQADKWIIFNCDNCGTEKEQLISHYKNNKSHCCSVKCAVEYRLQLRK